MKLIKVILTILLVIVLFCIIYIAIKGSILNDKSMSNSEYCYNVKFNKEDSILFKTTELSVLKSNFILKSNYRNDIKCFYYKNQGKLYITKIDLKYDRSMDKFIWFREVVTSETNMHSYAKFSGGDFDFKIIGEKIPKVSKIFFNLTGDGNKIQRNVYNKNFVSYYLPVSTFSLRYGEETPTDIFFGGKENIFGKRDKYSLMISFYKIHKALYVLILVPNKNDMNLEGDLFGKLMNDNSNIK